MPTDPKRSEKRMANPKTVAHTMGVSPRSVTEWCRTGRYRHRRTPGGHYRLEVDEDGWPFERKEEEP